VRIQMTAAQMQCYSVALGQRVELLATCPCSLVCARLHWFIALVAGMG
jgi:hypothetical protein